MLEQVMRELGDREDEDEVEEQLHRPDAMVGIGSVATYQGISRHARIRPDRAASCKTRMPPR
jgi:hypothetical protein